jgi:hypothetical protein
MFRKIIKVKITMDHGFSQVHRNATSVAGNVWERNGGALQLK